MGPFILLTNTDIREWDNSVDTAFSYVLEDPRSMPGNESLFSSPSGPNKFWGPPSLLSSGYRELILLE
jgi:hypothetical protein